MRCNDRMIILLLGARARTLFDMSRRSGRHQSKPTVACDL